jgi:hypothetical protein
MVEKRRDDVSLTALGQLTAKDLERPCGLVEKLCDDSTMNRQGCRSQARIRASMSPRRRLTPSAADFGVVAVLCAGVRRWMTAHADRARSGGCAQRRPEFSIGPGQRSPSIVSRSHRTMAGLWLSQRSQLARRRRWRSPHVDRSGRPPWKPPPNTTLAASGKTFTCVRMTGESIRAVRFCPPWTTGEHQPSPLMNVGALARHHWSAPSDGCWVLHTLRLHAHFSMSASTHTISDRRMTEDGPVLPGVAT